MRTNRDYLGSPSGVSLSASSKSARGVGDFNGLTTGMRKAGRILKIILCGRPRDTRASGAFRGARRSLSPGALLNALPDQC